MQEPATLAAVKPRRAALGAVVGLALLAVTATTAADPGAGSLLHGLRREHPRLYLSADGLEQLRTRIEASPLRQEWLATLRKDADRTVEKPVVAYEIPDGKRLLSVCRRTLDRVTTLGLLYRLEGDTRYRDALWANLEAAANFPDWNPSHFLDTAEMTHAFAIAYDWLYDDWAPGQRATLRKALLEFGLEPGLRCYRGEAKYGWWARSEHNWNQVCNGGLAAGALALADEEPEVAEEILRSGLASLPKALAEYAPDGAYKEGCGYWAYGTRYNIYHVAMLESALGRDFQIPEVEGFSKTAYFPVLMTGPTGYCFSFADASERTRPSDTASLFWLAARFDLPEVTRFAEPLARGEAFDLLFYREPEGTPRPLPLACHWRGLDAMVLRSAWDDPQATWVAFKAGSPAINHAQADLGSFVLDALGERWAIDMGKDDYNLPGYFSHKARWNYYRNRAEGHNTIVLGHGDGPDQVREAVAQLVRTDESADLPFGIMDLTPAYPAARKLQRGIARERDHVIVRDEIDCPKPTDVAWAMHTRANIAITDSGRVAHLTQGGKTLTVLLREPASARFGTRAAEPREGSPQPPKQKVNKGVEVLTIDLPKQKQVAISVRFLPGLWTEDGSAGRALPRNAPPDPPLADW